MSVKFRGKALENAGEHHGADAQGKALGSHEMAFCMWRAHHGTDSVQEPGVRPDPCEDVGAGFAHVCPKIMPVLTHKGLKAVPPGCV